MCGLILGKKNGFWRGQCKCGTALCQCLGVEGTVGFFFDSSCRAWGREADWDRRCGTCKLCSEKKTKHMKWNPRWWVDNSQWAGGKPSGDAQGWVSLRWWVVVGRPRLSCRTGWPWPALGACLGQFLAFSSGSSVGICSLAPSSERPSLLNRERLGWWDYKADRGLFLWWLWDCCLHGWYINSPISLLNFVPSPAVCSI